MRPAYERGAAPARRRTHVGRTVTPLAQMPAAVVQGIRGVFCDIDDTLTSEGKLTARAYSRAGAAACGRQAGRPDYRAARRLVRPYRAHVAGGRGGRRERRFLFLLRRCAEKTGAALPVRRANARGEPRKNVRRARANSARSAGLRARLGPVLPRGRSRDRLLRGRAASAVCRGRPDRRADARGRHDRENQLRSTSTAGSATTTSWA